jgi:two-component system LytT family sensor kinase
LVNLITLFFSQGIEMNLAKPLSFREIALHSLVWSVYLLFQILTFGKNQSNYAENGLIALCELPAQLIFTYTTLYWLVPRFLMRQNYRLFGLSLLALSVGCGLLHRIGLHFLYFSNFQPDKFLEQSPWETERLLVSTFYLITTSGLIIAFQMMRYGFQQKQLNQQLVNANLSAELQTLKDQIHPHFLFNTLNNLYGLTWKDPEKATEVVMRLSQLMHYMLYEGNLPKVALRKEIEYLQNYIALEKIRYGADLQINFTIKGETANLAIAPLLLLPFVENAFKHGLSQQLEEAWLQIHLSIDQEEMVFKVENSKPDRVGTNLSSANKTGIGLQNVSKRLQLLYPGRHRLKILDEAETYLITLTIGLKNTDVTVEENYENQVSVSR